jgi:hypothetical protein
MNTFRHVEVPSSAVKPDRYGKAGRMHARLKLDIEFCLLLFRLGLSLSGAVATTAIIIGIPPIGIAASGISRVPCRGSDPVMAHW